MKDKAHALAAVFRSRAVRRTQDDEHPAEAGREQAVDQEPPVRILQLNDDRGLPEMFPDESTGQQTYPGDRPKETVQLYLLGVAIALYLLALMFILFG